MGEIILSWASLIGPWFLLIFLDSTKIRRFLSVAFFVLMLNTIHFQMAEVYNWWTVTNNVFFLTNISSFTYGYLPVTTILIFYFTFPNPWLFFGLNIILDAFQAFVISPLVFEKFALYELDNMTNFELFLLIISLIPIIYIYQKWYEKRIVNY
ncbi:hypothetical protein D7Z54_03200 [Salibacterium salarium]|uniref:Lycopene cyclase domain-containing protein n=1 Tax=Salibacterium salarium TaxID=284579 RepID=A0A3R9WW85_9BACI|nr:hypothetical protein [Salibacterium salarium]RSL34858.1 hypothetical protein D7Z54_03200 [Salibacterium salarium]